MSEIGATELLRRLLGSAALAGRWREVRLAPGEVLFGEGDSGDAFYCVASGHLEVFQLDSDGNRIVLARIGPGSHVGELALIDGGVRSASVVALEASRLHQLRREDFLASLPSSPDLSGVTIDLLARRMRRTMGYVHCVTDWARQVAAGDYDSAACAVLAAADAADDPNIARFAATFRDMVDAVRAREEALHRELHRLRIEIDARQRSRQVSEITEDGFFRSLESRSRELRDRIKQPGSS